ncbi:MAG: PD40 domain-containing protein [Gemmatimonadetes bacterium]|nr:PD40 domain-containing protein [Gemmatimonadota bacterium]
MKRSILCSFALILLLAAPAVASQQTSPTVRLEAARYEVDVRGDVHAAIGLYRSLIEDFPDHRDIAALALVELGQAYETLGQAQAQDAYNRVLRDYADQREAAQRARARLAVLVGDDAQRNTDEHGLRTRRLWSADVGLNPGGLSPDGREVLFVDWGLADAPPLRGHADVAVYNIRSGRSRLVTDRYSQGPIDGYITRAIWSEDGAWLAYAEWVKEWTHQRLSVVRSDGSQDRVILDNLQFAEVVPGAFSSRTSTVAVILKGWDDVFSVGLVSTDGSLTILKTLGTHRPASLALSPDGRYVAFAYPPTEGEETHDVFVLATDGSEEIPISQHPTDDEMPMWTPDGGRIVFTSDRSGQRGLWAVRWEDGRVNGEPELVQPNLGPMVPMGLTSSGAPYFRVRGSESEVYVAELDLSGSGSLANTSRLTELHLGTNMRPAWSPDGERIAYLSRRGVAKESLHLVVKTLSTGEEHAHPLPFRLLERDSRPDWSQDGRFVWVEGGDFESDAPGRVSYRIDVLTGEVAREDYRRDFAGLAVGDVTEFHFTDGRQAQALRSLGIRIIGQTDLDLFSSGDEPQRPGEDLLFVRNGIKWIRSLTDQESLFTAPSEPIPQLAYLGEWPNMGQWQLSPDGMTLAAAMTSDTAMISVLVVLPLTGGAPRELDRVEHEADKHSGRIDALKWTPDGKQLIYVVEPTGGDADDVEIRIVDVSGGAPRSLDLPITPYQLANLRFHPDGVRVAYTVMKRFNELWLAEGLPWQDDTGR